MVLLGCIADDFTGATDLADTLARGGMRTVQFINTPAGPPPPDVDAAVIALKTRTAPATEAVARSLEALRWLDSAGARQYFFKYCSTFDSTDAGNIGPVADALLDALEEALTVVCPAFPENGRTVYQGHLFVGETLLSDSPMRFHPLTPMTDSNLVRVMGRQTRRRVGLIPYATVAAGPDAIRRAIESLRRDRERLRHRRRARRRDAGRDRRGVRRPAARHRRIRRGERTAPQFSPAGIPGIEGAATVARSPRGSRRRARRELLCGDAGPGVGGARTVAVVRRRSDGARGRARMSRPRRARWAEEHVAQGPILIYSTAPPETVARVQAAIGRERAGMLVERAFAMIAEALVGLGVRRMVVAGGETAGAVVQALGIDALRIGPPIETGVPWTLTIAAHPLALALKSGNFGSPEFFLRALETMR